MKHAKEVMMRTETARRFEADTGNDGIPTAATLCRRRAAALVLALLMGAAGLGLAGQETLAVTAPARDGIPPVRIHVIPHSDDPWDQQVKLAVRDAVLVEIGRILAQEGVGERSAVAAPVSPQDGWLDWGLYTARLQARAQQVLEEHQAPYQARVLWQQAPLSPRHRRQMDLPGEKHWTLQVVLGDGQGGNWWCVMFPPLCFVEPGRGFSLLPTEVQGSDDPRVPGPDPLLYRPRYDVPLSDGLARSTAQVTPVPEVTPVSQETAAAKGAGHNAPSEEQPAIRVGFWLLSRWSDPEPSIYNIYKADELLSWWKP